MDHTYLLVFLNCMPARSWLQYLARNTTWKDWHLKNWKWDFSINNAVILFDSTIKINCLSIGNLSYNTAIIQYVISISRFLPTFEFQCLGHHEPDKPQAWRFNHSTQHRNYFDCHKIHRKWSPTHFVMGIPILSRS